MTVRRGLTPWAVTAIAAMTLLTGCQFGSGSGQGDGESPPSSAPSSEQNDSDVVSTEDATAAQPEHGDPTGYCGDVDFDRPMSVYIGDKSVTCPMANDLAKRVKNKEGVEDQSGDGMRVGEWECAYGPSADDRPAFQMLCGFNGDKSKIVLFRPTGLKVQPGFHRNPHDFEQGYDRAYFTTPAKRFYCAIDDGEMGCDAHKGWPPGVKDVEDENFGGKQEPTSIVLESGSAARFEIFGDPAHTNLESSTDDLDAGNPVLGYGEVLYYGGFSCTADKNRGVVCQNGEHGFEVSSKQYKTY